MIILFCSGVRFSHPKSRLFVVRGPGYFQTDCSEDIAGANNVEGNGVQFRFLHMSKEGCLLVTFGIGRYLGNCTQVAILYEGFDQLLYK